MEKCHIKKYQLAICKFSFINWIVKHWTNAQTGCKVSILENIQNSIKQGFEQPNQM